MKTCGAKTRRGTPCKRRPCENGRCHLHGGNSLQGVDHPNFKHGRYVKFTNQKLRSKIEAFEEHDPLDLLDELTVQRTLFADYLERFRTAKLKAIDINSLMGWAAEIGRMVERIMKIRNDSALTAAEVKLLKARLLDVVPRYIDDPDQQTQFIIDLFGGDEEHPRRHPELVEGTTIQADD